MTVTHNRKDGKVTAQVIHQDPENTIYHAFWEKGKNLWVKTSTKFFQERFDAV